MRVSGFVMTDESGEVLAVSVGGSGDLVKSLAAPESKKELVAEHERLVDVLRSPDHKDDLAEADKQEAELTEYRGEAAGENLAKSHVKGYTRKDGTFVKEHEDRRRSEVEDTRDGHIRARNYHLAAESNERRKPVADAHRLAADLHGVAATEMKFGTHPDIAGLSEKARNSSKAAHEAELVYSFNQSKNPHSLPLDDLQKAHVKGYTRKDGTFVKEHDDSRQAAQPVSADMKGGAGNEADDPRVILGAMSAPKLKAAINAAVSKFGIHDSWSAPKTNDKEVLIDHIDSLCNEHHLRVMDDGSLTKAGAGTSSSGGGASYDHPNAVGKADFGSETPEKGWSMKFAGTDYTHTGKEGKSAHDDTPVREFESEDGHRVWADGAGRVHADSKDEVAGLRQKYEASSKPAKPKKAPAKNAAPKSASEAKAAPAAQADANESGWDGLPDDENPRYALNLIGSGALGAAARGEDDLNQRAKVELASRGLDSNAKWVGFKDAAKHHGVEVPKGDPDEVGGHMQMLHSAVLGAAARGELDLNKQAKHTLASRGHDSNGAWVGFDAAKKHHGIAEKKAKPMAKSLLFVQAGGADELLSMAKSVIGPGSGD